jgi:hypothetical protein
MHLLLLELLQGELFVLFCGVIMTYWLYIFMDYYLLYWGGFGLVRLVRGCCIIGSFFMG